MLISDFTTFLLYHYPKDFIKNEIMTILNGYISDY